MAQPLVVWAALVLLAPVAAEVGCLVGCLAVVRPLVLLVLLVPPLLRRALPPLLLLPAGSYPALT